MDADCYLPGTLRVGHDGSVEMERDGSRIPLRDPDGLVTAEMDGTRRTVAVDFGEIHGARPLADDESPGIGMDDGDIVLRATTKRFKAATYPMRNRRNGGINRRDRCLEPGQVPGGFDDAATEVIGKRDDGQIAVSSVTVVSVLSPEADPYRTEPFTDVRLSVSRGYGRRPDEGVFMRLSIGDIPLFDGPGWVQTEGESVMSSLLDALSGADPIIVGEHGFAFALEEVDDETVRLKLQAAPADIGLFPHNGVRVDRAALVRGVCRAGARVARISGTEPELPVDDYTDAEAIGFPERLAEFCEGFDVSVESPEPIAVAQELAADNDGASSLDQESLVTRLIALAREDANYRIAAIDALAGIGGELAVDGLRTMMETDGVDVDAWWAIGRALDELDSASETNDSPNVTDRDLTTERSAASADEGVDSRDEFQEANADRDPGIADDDPTQTQRSWRDQYESEAVEQRVRAMQRVRFTAQNREDETTWPPQGPGADGPPVEAVVATLEDDPEPECRRAAVTALVALGEDDVADTLTPENVRAALADEAPIVRSHAVDLVPLTSPPPIGAVLDRLTDAEPDERPTAKQAVTVLSRIARHVSGNSLGEFTRSDVTERLRDIALSGEAAVSRPFFEALEAVDSTAVPDIVKAVLESERPGPVYAEACSRLRDLDADPAWIGRQAGRAMAVAESKVARRHLGGTLFAYADDVPIDALRHAAIEAEGHNGTQAPIDVLVVIATANRPYRGQNPPWSLGERPRDRNVTASRERTLEASQAIVDAAIEGNNLWAIRAIPVIVERTDARDLLTQFVRSDRDQETRKVALSQLDEVIDVSTVRTDDSPGLTVLLDVVENGTPELRDRAAFVLQQLLCDYDVDDDVAATVATESPVADTLAAGLGDDIEDVRKSCASIIEELGAPTPAQLAALRSRVSTDSSWKVRRDAVNTIGAALADDLSADPAADRTALFEAVRTETESRVKQAAIEAIASQRTTEARNALAATLDEDLDVEHRESIVAALETEFLDGEHCEATVSLFADILRDDPDPSVRAAAVSGLFAADTAAAREAIDDIGGRETVPAVRNPILDDGPQGVRLATPVADGDNPDPDAPVSLRMRELAAALEDDPEIAELALAATAADDPSPYVRRVAVATLAEYFGTAVADTIEAVASSDHTPRVRRTAVRSLATIGATTSLERIADSDPREDVRLVANRALTDAD